jgi:hypothetical protein
MSEEKTAAMRLFLLESRIRSLILEWEKESERIKAPQVRRFYLYFAHELQKMMTQYRKDMPTFKEPPPL